MSTSLYDLSVPVFIRALRNLSAILDKGAAYAEGEGKAPESLLETRLYPDMHPLAYQVQRASDATRFFVARIGGLDNPPMADDETTFTQLQTRIAATIAYLEAAPREAIDGREDADVELKTPRATMVFKGIDYLLDFALPNVFFHCTTAYALLRHQGVPIGKMDFIGPVVRKE
ncbi:DUF1993 family protein [Sphingomonas sp. MMS24-J13]|uniref:DUF1993 domain-containing protein n=1 Tax=Sphingomonas sp. MMS24-J13 TaxID=3238686 RepID=UPI00384FA942